MTIRISQALTLLLCISLFSPRAWAEVPHPPIHTFKLENGLQVFFAENHELPEFWAEIVVRAGSENDPPESTGLAHYLEHLLFKGTQRLGTQNFRSERPLYEKIIQLYDQRFAESDSAKREQLAAEINSVSVEAGKLAIPGEFDQLYSRLGKTYLNAMTTNDMTVYEARLPKNRFAQWAAIESDRFRLPIFRAFQWELEAVYEEKNRSLDNSGARAGEAARELVFKNHPYHNAVLGSVEHLKNPSLKKVIEFFNRYYVPGNMAVVIAGDLNPKEVERTLRQRFSSWPKKTVPKVEIPFESHLSKREEVTIHSHDNPMAYIVFPTVHAQHVDAPVLQMIDYLLNNSGDAGLLDVNLVLKNKIKSAGSGQTLMKDGGVFELWAYPKPQQPLPEVEQLMLGQLELIKAGQFDGKLMESIVQNAGVHESERLESNSAIAERLANYFVEGRPWPEAFRWIDRLKKVTKQDVIRVAKHYFTDAHAVVYRTEGDPAVEHISKPKLSPFPTSATSPAASAAFTQFLNMPSRPLPPNFITLGRDYQKAQVGETPIYTAHNPHNDLSTLTIELDYGRYQDRAASAWLHLLQYMGTSKLSASDRARLFYDQALTIKTGEGEKTLLTISGPDAKVWSAIPVIQDWLEHPIFDAELVKGKIADSLESRRTALLDPGTVQSYASNWLSSGKARSSVHQVLSNDELKSLNTSNYSRFAEALLHARRRIFYTGPENIAAVTQHIATLWPATTQFAAPNPLPPIEFITLTEPTVFFYHVPQMSQAHILALQPGLPFSPKDIDRLTSIKLFNNFFSNGMHSVIPREIREKRSLAYEAHASYTFNPYPNEPTFFSGYVGTQSDKAVETLNVFDELIRNVPWTEHEFSDAQKSFASIFSQKSSFRSVLYSAVLLEDMGFSKDPAEEEFKRIFQLNLQTVAQTISNESKGHPLAYVLVGDKSKLDLEAIGKKFKIRTLEAKDIFPY